MEGEERKFEAKLRNNKSEMAEEKRWNGFLLVLNKSKNRRKLSLSFLHSCDKIYFISERGWRENSKLE